MRRCLKVLNLLIEKKVAEVEGDKLKGQSMLLQNLPVHVL